MAYDYLEPRCNVSFRDSPVLFFLVRETLHFFAGAFDFYGKRGEKTAVQVQYHKFK